jgi:hypothetical protein
VLGYLEEHLGWIVDAIDPVGPTLEGDVAVGIDHTRHDRGPRPIDHLEVVTRARIGLPIERSDPRDSPIHHEDAHADLEPLRPAVGDRHLAVEDPSHGAILWAVARRNGVGPRRDPWPHSTETTR